MKMKASVMLRAPNQRGLESPVLYNIFFFFFSKMLDDWEYLKMTEITV